MRAAPLLLLIASASVAHAQREIAPDDPAPRLRASHIFVAGRSAEYLLKATMGIDTRTLDFDGVIVVTVKSVAADGSAELEFATKRLTSTPTGDPKLLKAGVGPEPKEEKIAPFVVKLDRQGRILRRPSGNNGVTEVALYLWMLPEETLAAGRGIDWRTIDAAGATPSGWTGGRATFQRDSPKEFTITRLMKDAAGGGEMTLVTLHSSGEKDLRAGSLISGDLELKAGKTTISLKLRGKNLPD